MSERSRCAGDGANDGLQVRQAGKSSRATKHKTYEHGIRGYDYRQLLRLTLPLLLLANRGFC
jgi:hypothetical protein